MKWGLVAFVLLLTGFGVVYIFRPETETLTHYGFLALNLAILLTSFSLSRAAIASPRGSWQRRMWLGLAVGFWMWLAAGLMEVVDYLRGRPAYAGMADFFWVSGYVPMFAGLLFGMRISAPSERRNSVLIAAVLTAAYAAIFFLYLLPHVQDAARNLPAKVLDITYTSFNFLLLATFLVIRGKRSLDRDSLQLSFSMMIIATGIMICSDILLGYFTDPDSPVFQLLDLPYFAIYFLFFLAGSMQRSPTPNFESAL